MLRTWEQQGRSSRHFIHISMLRTESRALLRTLDSNSLKKYFQFNFNCCANTHIASSYSFRLAFSLSTSASTWTMLNGRKMTMILQSEMKISNWTDVNSHQFARGVFPFRPEFFWFSLRFFHQNEKWVNWECVLILEMRKTTQVEEGNSTLRTAKTRDASVFRQIQIFSNNINFSDEWCWH